MSRTDDNRAESFDEQDPSRDADGDKKRSRRPASKSMILRHLMPFYFNYKKDLKPVIHLYIYLEAHILSAQTLLSDNSV